MSNTLTDTEKATLLQKSESARGAAYCPYSSFRVGCALLCADGTWVTGANVENASYPVGICAERVALAKAITDGKKEFRALGVSAGTSEPVSPCGMCRQFIREFCETDMPVFMYGTEGDCVVMTLEELLPKSFGPSDLRGSGQR